VIGRLTSDNAPVIELEVIEAGAVYEMVVDTGFNDYLYLPEDLIVAWNLPFVITTSVTLADGSNVIADLYEAEVIWFSASERVPVLAGPVGCDALIGMGLLAGCRIELDAQQQEVRLERL
jgi:clan AA aspartic protease